MYNTFSEFLGKKVTADLEEMDCEFESDSWDDESLAGKGYVELEGHDYLSDEEYEEMEKETREEFRLDSYDEVYDELADKYAKENPDFDEDSDEDVEARHEWIMSVIDEEIDERFEMDPEIEEQRDWTLIPTLSFETDEEGCLISIETGSRISSWGDSGLGEEDDEGWTSEDVEAAEEFLRSITEEE